MKKIYIDKYHKILENFFSLFILQGLNYLLPLITIPYLTRTLGPENYGKTIFATSVITYFQVICDYGFNMSATRNISVHRDDKCKVESIYSNVMTIKIITTSIGFLILLLLLNFIPRFKADYLLYIFTYFGVIGQTLFPVWLFQGIEEMKYITKINLIVKIISTIGIFAIITDKSQYVLLPLVNSLVLILLGLYSIYFVNKKFDMKITKPGIKQMLDEIKAGWHIFITSFFSNIISNTGSFILGIFLGDTMLGYYGAIEKITKALVSMFSPLTTAIFPYFNKLLNEDKKQGIKTLFKLSKYVLGCTLIATILLFIFSNSIVLIICGEKYVKYSFILKIHSFWIILSILNNFIGIQFLISISQGSVYSKSFIFAGMFMLLIDLILIKFIGIYSVPIGMVLGELILTLSMIYFIIKKKLYI